MADLARITTADGFTVKVTSPEAKESIGWAWLTVHCEGDSEYGFAHTRTTAAWFGKLEEVVTLLQWLGEGRTSEKVNGEYRWV